MRGLAIGREEDCGMSTYTQWVGGWGWGGRKKVSDYTHVCFCCSKGVGVPLNPAILRGLAFKMCIVCLCENTYV